MYVRTYVCMYVCVYVCMYVRYVYMYVCCELSGMATIAPPFYSTVRYYFFLSIKYWKARLAKHFLPYLANWSVRAQMCVFVCVREREREKAVFSSSSL